MIGKGIFHTNIVVRDLVRSLRFYTGLFGMQETEFKDGDLVFLTTPGRDDILTLNPSGRAFGFPGGCSRESARELKENQAGVQGGLSHFGYMLPNLEEYERVIASVGEYGGQCSLAASTVGCLPTLIFQIPTDTWSRSTMGTK